MGNELMASGTDYQMSTKPPNGNIRTSPLKKPNYNVLHSQPLPLTTYPLPQFVPHNPLSLLYVAYTYLSQLLFPPSPQPRIKYHGYYSSDTGSVHVTDQRSMRALWESGFFGKGSLSRSEPSWLDREKRRKGIIVNETSEEVTRRRRDERKEFKRERARKEQDAIMQQLNEERKPRKKADLSVLRSDGIEQGAEAVVLVSNPTFANGPNECFGEAKESPEPGEFLKTAISDQNGDDATIAHPSTSIYIEDQEHLQLTPEETFFLVYGLGVLDVYSQVDSTLISLNHLLQLFRQCSYFPSRSISELGPDDPFLLSYVVYHHFRSLGWVVRSGIKFAVDYLLYNRGPVFSHAEFAVIILPSYKHAYWHSSKELEAQSKKKETKTWWWLHCVNRVQSQVRKSLVLVYVQVPPPIPRTSSNGEASPSDIRHCLQRYEVREIVVRRWTPNRSRD